MSSVVSNLVKYFTEGSTAQFEYRLGDINKFCLAVEKEGATVNDVVRVPFVSASAQTVQTFSHGTGYTSPDSYVDGKSVTLSSWLYRPFEVTDSDAKSITPEVFARMVQRNANLLGNDILSVLLTNTSSFANYIQPSGSLWKATTGIIGLTTSASNARWDERELVLVAKPTLYTKMIDNTTVFTANTYGSDSVIKKGYLSQYFGWTPYVVDALPSTVQGLALTKDALALGFTIPTPQAGNNLEDVAVITLPGGLKIQNLHFYDNYKRKHTFVSELVVGAAVLNASAGYNVLVTNMNL